ncbi:hypothetical protein NX059_006541 [Plenodomus lindquistii]|nr:hypothetical protein NX059_006541 [Plenodomus lindquistii]
MADSPANSLMDQFSQVMQAQKEEITAIENIDACMAGLGTLAHERGARMERLAQAHVAEIEKLKKQHAEELQTLKRSHSDEMEEMVEVKDSAEWKATKLRRALETAQEDRLTSESKVADLKKHLEGVYRFIDTLRLGQPGGFNRGSDVNGPMHAFRQVKTAIRSFLAQEIATHEEVLSSMGEGDTEVLGYCEEHAKDFRLKIDTIRSHLMDRRENARDKRIEIASPLDHARVTSQLASAKSTVIQEMNQMNAYLWEVSEWVTKVMGRMQKHLDEAQLDSIEREKTRLRKAQELMGQLDSPSELEDGNEEYGEDGNKEDEEDGNGYVEEFESTAEFVGDEDNEVGPEDDSGYSSDGYY